MAGTSIMLFSTLLVLAVIFFALWFFERTFAKKEGKYAGLTLPVLLFVLSTFSVLNSIPAMLEGVSKQQYTMLQVIIVTVVFFIVFNIPSFWTYAVYRRTRKKLGRPAWPFGKDTTVSSDKKSDTSK